MTDDLTILTHSRSRLAKLWLADGTISSYDETKYYQVDEQQVDGIASLSEALTVLESLPHSAVIRGKFKGADASATIDVDAHKQGLARKIKALYDDAPHHWVMIDVDKFASVADPMLDPEAAVAEYITASLPAAFHDISCHWQLSSSAGHVSADGKLSAHLWFWLATPASGGELHTWAKASGLAGMGLDISVFNSVQFHYTSAPLFADGVADPVPRRSGLFDGLFGDTVELNLKSAYGPSGTGVSSYQNTSTDLAVWDDDLMGLSPTLDWSLAFGREVLFDLNADSDRATWLNDLAAFHHEFNGSQEALDIAVEWSETAANFGSRKDVEDRWASFGKYRGGNPITGRWLLKRRTERHAHLKYDARTEWASAISGAADEFAVREKLCPQIAKDSRLDDLGKEALAQLLFDAFKRLGTKYPIAECRKLLVEKRANKTFQKNDLPAWVQPWVYITNDDQFFRPDSEEWLSLQGFNARFNRELPADEDSGPPNASWTVLNDMELPVVTKAMYLPWADSLFTQAGVSCVNTYRPSSAPVPVPVLTLAHQAVIDVVVRHITILAGGRPEVVATMLDWLAHNVQKPGVKIRWAPLWKGVEGDGKTVMGSLLASVMGRINVRNVSPKVLATDFTGWAEGAAVAVLEEIKLTGHNKYDILNSLKPFITNDSIEVHSKGKDTREAINTVNYIAFTNYPDALPLTDTDRRWWTVFTPFMSRDDMAAAVSHLADDLGAYFDTLHDVIQQQPAVLRRWLLDYPISAAFKPNGSAPMTDEKALMIGMGTTEEEDAVLDVLANCEASDVPGEERGPTRGVTPTLFSSRCMGDALVLSDLDVAINTTSRNRLFSKVGFTKLPKKVKWNGEAHTIWVKGAVRLEPNKIRLALLGTLPKNTDGEKEGDFFTKGSDSGDLF